MGGARLVFWLGFALFLFSSFLSFCLPSSSCAATPQVMLFSWTTRHKLLLLEMTTRTTAVL
jgi:hypothetical protein